jgi:hypothetical protein
VRAAYERIAADMRAIWGDMALAMLRKRLRDVHADLENLTREQLVQIVELLRAKTLPSILGEEGAATKAEQYLAWVDEVGAAAVARVAS